MTRITALTATILDGYEGPVTRIMPPMTHRMGHYCDDHLPDARKREHARLAAHRTEFVWHETEAVPERFLARDERRCGARGCTARRTHTG